MMDKNVLRALEACPLFEHLSEKEIEDSLAGIDYNLVEYDKKELYALQGDPIHYADIVISGEMATKTNNSSGKCVKFNTNTKGKLIAPSLIFNQDRKLSVTFEIVRPTVLLRMTPTDLHTIMHNDDRILMNFIRILSLSHLDMCKKVRMLTLHTIREKVASYLLDEARRRNTNKYILSISRQDIADMFAIQKYSLQRVLSEFRKEGIIQLSGKSISILDREKLESMAAI